MNHIEEKIIQTIDEHRDEIIAFAKDIQSHPEPGFMRREQPHMLRLFCVALDSVYMGDLHAQGFALSGWNRTDRTLRLSENLTPSDVSRIRWLIPLTGQHMHADTTHRLQP